MDISLKKKNAVDSMSFPQPLESIQYIASEIGHVYIALKDDVSDIALFFLLRPSICVWRKLNDDSVGWLSKQNTQVSSIAILFRLPIVCPMSQCCSDRCNWVIESSMAGRF